jgi:hypothetical protein
MVTPSSKYSAEKLWPLTWDSVNGLAHGGVLSVIDVQLLPPFVVCQRIGFQGPRLIPPITTDRIAQLVLFHGGTLRRETQASREGDSALKMPLSSFCNPEIEVLLYDKYLLESYTAS